MLRATAGPPKYSTVSSVKNPALAGLINNNIAGFNGVQGDINSSLSSYISKYMAGEGAAAGRTKQEIGSVDQFYNGSMANQLAQLRAQRSTAVNSAADVAAKQALAAKNRSRVAGQGGGSSYDSRVAIGALAPIRAQAAVDDATQARSDLGYVTENQLGLSGRRNNMAAQQAAYGLVPQQQRLAMLGSENQYLSGLGNLDQQNTFYGLQQAPNMWADIADSADQGILNAAGVAGSLKGGMSRGGTVRGPGSETSDSIPVRLSKDEYVLPAEVAHMTGVLPLLDRIRKIALKHREERLKFGHLKHDHVMRRGMHPIHGKAMEERMKMTHEAIDRMASGGRVKGYADGGAIDGGGDLSGLFDEYELGSAGNKKPKGGGGGGGGGGGAFGSAQQLGARAMADLTPQWGQSVMNNAPAIPIQAAVTTMPDRTPPAPATLPNTGMAPRAPYFHPDNASDISPGWRQWAEETSRYYSDPKSPGYISPNEYQ